MTTGTVEMVTSSITSSSSPCRIATPPSRCTRRTPYLLRSTLQRVQAESLLPGVPRRALQVAQSSESEALFQLGALQTTAATPAASKAAARTRSHRRDLGTPTEEPDAGKSHVRFRKEREPTLPRCLSTTGVATISGGNSKPLVAARA